MFVSKGILAIVLIMLLQAGGYVQADTQLGADELYRVAAEAYQQARQTVNLSGRSDNPHWGKAIESFEAFVESFPDDSRAANARFYLGEAFGQTRNWRSASAAYEAFIECLKGHPHTMEATSRFRIGEAAYFSGDFGRAEFALRDFSERFPQNGLLKYALPYLSDLAFRRQDYDEVIRIACQYQDRETTDDFPIDFNVHFRAAQANHYLGRFEAVQSICREMSHQRMLIESDLGHEFALVAAEAAWAQEGCNQTIRSFQRIAASQAPRELRCRAMIRAAECLCDLGEFTAAIDQYLTIIVEYPNEPVAELAAQRITKLQNHRMANTVAQPCKVDLS